MKKVAYTKDGATKLVDPEQKEQIAVIVAAGWKPAKPEKPVKGE